MPGIVMRLSPESKAQTEAARGKRTLPSCFLRTVGASLRGRSSSPSVAARLYLTLANTSTNGRPLAFIARRVAFSAFNES